MRVILFTGKGGVGKTSVAAATGVRAAELGYKTLVMSLDPAHSLSDSFDLDRKLMDRGKGLPVQVGERLWIQEVDVQEEIHRYWGEIYRYIASLFSLSGIEEIVAEELAILPGMEEVSCILYINQYVREKAFDVMLLDCAPTGESLRFVSLPTTLEWYMNRIFKIERKVAKVAGPILRGIYSVPVPHDDYFEAVERLYERLKGVDEYLGDPALTSVRLVTNPEKMVLKESQRAFMYFCLYGLCVDAVIMNRVLPSEVRDDYFARWRATQERYIEETKSYFAPVPILSVPLADDEVLGVENLRALARNIYGDNDPSKSFMSERPYHFSKENGVYKVRVKLPFLSKEDVDLAKSGDELIIRIGNFKRHVILPRSMVGREPSGAKLDGDVLTVTFEQKKEPE
jgi:arsenite-transporting ATPase